MSDPLVSICIPTLHGGPMLQRCLDSIEEYTTLDYEFVIVGAGSRSRGFTKPMNRALRAARGDYLVALNDDVEVTWGWLDPLVRAASRPGVLIVAPDQRSTDGEQVMCGWCVVGQREAWEQLGFYDERFVFWCSDIDLAKRCINQDAPPLRVRTPSPLKHVPGQTPREPWIEEEAVKDLARYQEKWGTSALEDKARLRSVDA